MAFKILYSILFDRFQIDFFLFRFSASLVVTSVFERLCFFFPRQKSFLRNMLSGTKLTKQKFEKPREKHSDPSQHEIRQTIRHRRTCIDTDGEYKSTRHRRHAAGDGAAAERSAFHAKRRRECCRLHGGRSS